METKKQSKEYALLHRLGGFSRNMAHHHYLENLSEFVLHDLCSHDLFNISKAAYIVNNPDFACLKGVAGYDQTESFRKGSNWEMQKDFTAHMKQSDFNQKVRHLFDASMKIDGNGSEKNKVHKLADEFEIENPSYHIWNMKYDNQGILIFEKPDDSDGIHEHMVHFVPMLSFCTVF